MISYKMKLRYHDNRAILFCKELDPKFDYAYFKKIVMDRTHKFELYHTGLQSLA